MGKSYSVRFSVAEIYDALRRKCFAGCLVEDWVGYLRRELLGGGKFCGFCQAYGSSAYVV